MLFCLRSGVAMMVDGQMDWAGVTFRVLGHRDGRMIRAPGLFAFVRRESADGPLMLRAGQAEDIARVAGPAHADWGQALALGMNELHVSFPIPRRIDRLQLFERIVRRVQPLLNIVEDVDPAAPCRATGRQAQR